MGRGPEAAEVVRKGKDLEDEDVCMKLAARDFGNDDISR